MAFKPELTINGTFAQVYVDGVEVADAISAKAEIDIDTVDVPMLGTLGKKKKMIGYEGKGEIKLNKTTSRFVKLLTANLKSGKATTVQILIKVSDPDAAGAERFLIKDAMLTKLTLADVEAKKITEETIPFVFSEWELIDTI